MEITIKDALIQILKVHEAELKFFIQKNALDEMLRVIAQPRSDFINILKARPFSDTAKTIFGYKMNIEVCYLQRKEIIDRVKLILEIWSPHLSMELLSLLWYIATDQNDYFKQNTLFINLNEGYPEKGYNDSLDALWERFCKSHFLFLEIAEICKKTYPNESYFHTWIKIN